MSSRAFLAAFAGALAVATGGLAIGTKLYRAHRDEQAAKARWREIERNAAAMRSIEERAAARPTGEAVPAHDTGAGVMYTSSTVAVHAGGRTTYEPLPESNLGYGASASACWSAPDGALYVVGTQYRSGPGNNGIIWKRSTAGTWSTELVLLDRPLTSIAGRRANDIWVGAVGGVAIYDGRRWSYRKLGGDIIAMQVWRDGAIMHGAMESLLDDRQETYAFHGTGMRRTRVREIPPVSRSCTHGDTTFEVQTQKTDLASHRQREQQQRREQARERRESEQQRAKLEQEMLKFM